MLPWPPLSLPPHAHEQAPSQPDSRTCVPGVASQDGRPSLNAALSELARQWRQFQGLHGAAAHSPVRALLEESRRQVAQENLHAGLLRLGAMVLERYLEEGEVVVRRAESPSTTRRPARGASGPAGTSVRENARYSEDLQHALQLYQAIRAELPVAGYPLHDSTRVHEELQLLERNSTGDRLERWAYLPAEFQRALTGYVAARLRHLQDELSVELAHLVARDERVGLVFRRLSQHMDRHRPGFVNGLAMAHTPAAESWQDDVRRFEQTLDEHAERYFAQLMPKAPASRPPDAWLWKNRLAEARILMLGGEPLAQMRHEIMRQWEPAELHWPRLASGPQGRAAKSPQTGQTGLESIVERIAQGHFDVVVLWTAALSPQACELVQTACHSATGPVETVFIEDGPDMEALLEGIERFITP